MKKLRSFGLLVTFFVFFLFVNQWTPHASSTKQLRRPLRIALYPYVPGKADMYWTLEQQFEKQYQDIDLQFVDLSAYYYSGQLMDALSPKNPKADVFEVDTVFLADAVNKGLIDELPTNLFKPDEFFTVASVSARYNGKLYGVPHWVCGNFLFFRKDDAEYGKFKNIKTISDLEKVIGRPTSVSESLVVDLRGSSTLGEKYLDAMLDEFSTTEKVLKNLKKDTIHPKIYNYLNRFFSLCSGGLCDSDKHHDFGQFYSRQFAARKARAMIGYSERMYFVVDHFLHGVRENQPSIGHIEFRWNRKTNSYDAIGKNDIDVVPAGFSDKPAKALSWVDVLSIRKGLSKQKKSDAIALINFFNSKSFTTSLLIPKYGHAPRYLLPARKSIYLDSKLLRAAPLYKRFLGIMNKAVSISSPGLNDILRSIGKKLEKRGFGTQGKQ